MRQQLVDAAVGVAGEPLQHVTQVGHGSCPLSLADCTRLMTIAARWLANSLPQNSHACKRSLFDTFYGLTEAHLSAQERTGAGLRDDCRHRRSRVRPGRRRFFAALTSSKPDAPGFSGRGRLRRQEGSYVASCWRNTDTWNIKGRQRYLRGLNHNYRDAELDDIAARVQPLAPETLTTHPIVNNNIEDQGAAKRCIPDANP